MKRARTRVNITFETTTKEGGILKGNMSTILQRKAFPMPNEVLEMRGMIQKQLIKLGYATNKEDLDVQVFIGNVVRGKK